MLLTNDPWDGTGHLNDFTVVTPVFLSSEIIGFFASTSHIADVGGRVLVRTRMIYSRKVCESISFLLEKGKPNKTLMELIKANVRDPLVAEGDLYSLIACNEAGSVDFWRCLTILILGIWRNSGRLFSIVLKMPCGGDRKAWAS